jgi:hypothetical protein
VTELPEVDRAAFIKAFTAVEDEIIDRRDRRIFIIRGNGVVVNEYDGSDSPIKRMSTAEALEMGIRYYLAAIDGGVS